MDTKILLPARSPHVEEGRNSEGESRENRRRMTMKTSLITTPTDGQRKQVKRFAEDAVDRALAEAHPDKDAIQKLIERGGEFQARVVIIIKELSAPNQFADEEIKSGYAYPDLYKVKGIAEQANILRQLFPGIGFADEKIAEQPLPPGAEGWFAIPRWQTLVADLPAGRQVYGEAVQKVFEMIASKRRFYNYRDGELGAKHLRQHAKTVKMFQRLGDEQKGFDILVVPAQFGLRHRGRSVRRAREVFQANEFGLGAFASGIMLLTHPEREVHWDQLHIDCAGDEFAPYADCVFSEAPVFGFSDGGVEFLAGWFGEFGERCGSASGFLPQ